jgi:hypothetical protein
MLIESLHEHIVDELRTNTKTDTIFILTAILLNFIALGVNSIVAAIEPYTSGYIVFSLFVVLIVIVNFVAIVGLNRGKYMRQKLLEGLLKIYEDQQVDGYYDPSLLAIYNVRYNLFIIAVISTGVIAIAVPIVLLVI